MSHYQVTPTTTSHPNVSRNPTSATRIKLRSGPIHKHSHNNITITFTPQVRSLPCTSVLEQGLQSKRERHSHRRHAPTAPVSPTVTELLQNRQTGPRHPQQRHPWQPSTVPPCANSIGRRSHPKRVLVPTTTRSTGARRHFHTVRGSSTTTLHWIATPLVPGLDRGLRGPRRILTSVAPLRCPPGANGPSRLPRNLP
jgi:hypothetical protein